MKINELRVGNYVKYNKNIVSVYSISNPLPDKNKHFDNKEKVTLWINGLIDAIIEEIEPIPLTEELFNGNGFIFLEDLDYYGNYFMSEDMRIDVYESSNGWMVHIDDRECSTAFSKCLKYVHELQNAYYVSTGKEFEVKL